MSIQIVIATALLLGAGKTQPAPAEQHNQLTRAEKKVGWRLLFDGKSAAGWRGYKQKDAPTGWQVKDGILAVVAKKAGDLITIDRFEDFELSLQWRIAAKGNSGVMYRVAETSGPTYVTGPEFQLNDDESGPVAQREDMHSSGALYDMYAPARPLHKAAGEWNDTRIVLRGKHVEHWLNGVKVVDCELGSEDWNQRLARSKWKAESGWAKSAQGHIALQEHGDVAEFRDIKIRTPAPSGH